jgi:polyribonucleotide nucleotidyltransferase
MSFETGKMGRQAGGAVVSRTMDTMVYTTVCNEREPQAVDFTPLRVYIYTLLYIYINTYICIYICM